MQLGLKASQSCTTPVSFHACVRRHQRLVAFKARAMKQACRSTGSVLSRAATSCAKVDAIAYLIFVQVRTLHEAT